jgi:hypothetical protein
MKPDLSSQLRAYFTMVDAAQPALQPADVIGRGAAVRPLTVSRPIRYRPALVMAAAAGIAAVVGTAIVLSVRPWAGGDAADLVPDTPPVVVPPTGTEPLNTLPSPDAWCEPGVAPLSGPDDGDPEDAAWGPDGSRWEIVDPPESGSELRRTHPDGRVVSYPMPPQAKDFGTPDWPSPEVEPTLYAPFDLEVGADGAAWLVATMGPATSEGLSSGLLRFDPGRWSWEEVPIAIDTASGGGAFFTPGVTGIEATCDGSLWVLVAETNAWEPPEAQTWFLALIAADDVTRIPFDLGPGTLPEPETLDEWYEDVVPALPGLILADDRAVWLAHGNGLWNYATADDVQVFPGVVRWDGERWTRYLDGEVVLDLVLHDDGTATVQVLRADRLVEVRIEP